MSEEHAMKDVVRLENIFGVMEKDKKAYQDVVRKKLLSKEILCLFPAGVGSRYMIDYLRGWGIEPDFVSDNDIKKLSGRIKDIPCIAVEDLRNKNAENITFLVESTKYFKEIKKGLENRGFTDIQRIYLGKAEGAEYVKKNMEDFRDGFINLMGLLADEKSKQVVETLILSWLLEDVPENYFAGICDKNIYFDDEIVKLSEDECFVDCGSYTGDTTEDLLQRVPEFQGNIYQFEIDPQIYDLLCQNMAKYKEMASIMSFPFGVSDEEAEILIESGEGNSHILQTSNHVNKIRSQVQPLDVMLQDKKITFIKMDIEGGELKALHGAKNIIRNQKPKLAICLYHKPEDIFQIPLYIKSLVPEYEIFIRHYSDLMWDTVCYAVYRGK